MIRFSWLYDGANTVKQIKAGYVLASHAKVVPKGPLPHVLPLDA